MLVPIPLDTHILQKGYAPATKVLAVVNIVVFVLFGQNEAFFNDMSLVDDGNISLRLITYQFLHADLWHLLSNLIFLLPFGALLEEKAGKVKLLIFYFVGGIVAGLVWQKMYTPPFDPLVNNVGVLVGASGSISALIGAALVLRPQLPLTGLLWIFILLHFFQLPVWIWSLYFFLKDFFFYQFGNESNVAYEAHIGGFVCNFVLCLVALKLGLIRSASSDLLGSFGFRTKQRELSNEKKLKSEMGFRDVSTVDHVIEEINKGEAEKFDIERLLILSRKAVNTGKPVEGYQILQGWLEQHDEHPDGAEVAYEIGLICLRHLNKKDLTRDWLNDALNRHPKEILEKNIRVILEALED